MNDAGLNWDCINWRLEDYSLRPSTTGRVSLDQVMPLIRRLLVAVVPVGLEPGEARMELVEQAVVDLCHLAWTLESPRDRTLRTCLVVMKRTRIRHERATRRRLETVVGGTCVSLEPENVVVMMCHAVSC